MSANAEDRIHRWRNMVTRDSSDQFAHSKLGAVYLWHGRPMQAAAEYRRVVELNPGNADAWRALGDALVAAGMTRDAEAALRTADEITPADQ